MTETEHESEVILMKDTPYLALTGKLWGVFCEDLGENQPCYNGTAVYFRDAGEKCPTIIDNDRYITWPQTFCQWCKSINLSKPDLNVYFPHVGRQSME